MDIAHVRMAICRTSHLASNFSIELFASALYIVISSGGWTSWLGICAVGMDLETFEMISRYMFYEYSEGMWWAAESSYEQIKAAGDKAMERTPAAGDASRQM
ncbi:hypothetical protein JOM56_013122 [Amanita muscaria]